VDLLEEHRRLLRTEFRKYLGHEVKTIGDGFLIEFTSAVAAVDCAVKIQKILERRNELASPERRIHIRIGIHLGDVLPCGKDIVGDGVNIAARIEALAEAGGVAVTQQVYDQVYKQVAIRLDPNRNGRTEEYRKTRGRVPSGGRRSALAWKSPCPPYPEQAVPPKPSRSPSPCSRS